MASSFVAALCKEIGITIVGAMVLYDIFFDPPPGDQHRPTNFASRKLMRVVLLCGTGLAYVALRSFVAGDQLVRIYRNVSVP